MIKIKKAAAFAAALAICMTGCGSSADSSSKEKTTSAVTAAPSVTLPPKEESEAETVTETESEPAADDSDTEPAEEDIYAPAAWLVTAPDGSQMFMMGSMHVLKEECYPLPDYIQQAFDSADVLAVECDITDITKSFEVSLAYNDKLTYSDGETAADHIGEEEWSDIAGYIEAHDEDPDAYKSYAVWYLSQLLESFAVEDAGLDTKYGLDRHLLEEAHDSGKEIYEVESMEFQMALLSGFSDEIYAVTLSGYSGENIDLLTDQYIGLYDAWRSGDVDGVLDEETGGEDMTEEEKQLTEEYYQALLYDRNVGMAEAAEQLMADGKNVFYVVGAAHFVGEGGIIDLLEKDGYTAERLGGNE